jgi:hypothetical protein
MRPLAELSVPENANLIEKRMKILTRLMYLQAFFLSSAYIIGVWQTLIINKASITSPYVILHAFMAGSFAITSGTIGLLARIQDMKNVSNYNFALFFITVGGGSSGFVLLGNQIATIMRLTNLFMISVVGIGMPVTAFSLASTLKRINLKADDVENPILLLLYLAVGSLSLHLFLGVSVLSTSLYGVMLLVHLAFAALTAALILGALVILTHSRLGKGSTLQSVLKITPLLLALIFTVVSAAAGAVFLTLGPIYYVVEMAEIAILSYGFMFLGINESFKE